MSKADEKKTRPESLAPPSGGTYKAFDIALEDEEATAHIALPGGGGVIVYSNGYVDRWG